MIEDKTATVDAQKLNDLRASIDTIDAQIQSLIVKRAQCAANVALEKQKDANLLNEPQDPVYYRPEREAQVLRAICERDTGPITQVAMARLFREIMSVCLSLEQPMSVCYLGPEGTFTESATMKHFGKAVNGVPLATIDEVFREVESGACHYGVVPVENSSEGMVNHTLDCLMNSPLKICGEVELRIHHHFLKSDLTQAKNISKVYAHQQTLAQCRKWLDAHWPKVERIAVSSNAEAARRIRGEWHSAAIAGDMAAERYDLQYIAKNIEDNPDNTTRFLMIGRKLVLPSGEDKTSMIVSMKNHPGALYSLLEPLSLKGISMTRLETRPASSGKWSYVFFIDFEGHENDSVVQEALALIQERAVYVHSLGSYPKSVLGVD